VREEGFSAVADIDLRVSRDSSSTVPNVHSHAPDASTVHVRWSNGSRLSLHIFLFA
jgi:hypothetical protein